MRIESTTPLPVTFTQTLFQGASSQNEDWKIVILWDSGQTCGCFKVHPRKMRIERSYWFPSLYVVLSFKVHPRKMRIESGTFASPWRNIQKVSRCILAKWGLKAFRKVYIHFRRHKFQGASSQNEDWKCPLSCPDSFCSDLFQGASSQNEDWKSINPEYGLPTTGGFKVHPRKMRIERCL